MAMPRPYFRSFGLKLPIALLVLVSIFSAFSTAESGPTSTAAKISTPFVDPVTGIAFERFFGARTTFGFGVALPPQPNDSFIGQMSFPLSGGSGWGAMGLTGNMKNNFFLAAWADGAGGVMASFRQGTNEDNPPEVTGNFAVRPIAQGTAVNGSFLTYTFLCQGCLNAGLGLGAAATGADAVMGWALSLRAVQNPASPGTPLGFHERGFGPFTMRLAQSKNAQFDTWAAMAGAPVSASSKATSVALNVASSGSEGGGDD